MGRIASDDGITAIISTSHSVEAVEVGRVELEERLQEVRAAWQGAGLDILLYLGVEIYLTPQTPLDLELGRLWPLAGSRYLLVELPYQPWPAYADGVMFDLQLMGYIPILAHPERYTAIVHDPNRMYALAERGILSQVTAAALLGAHGGEARRSCETLLKHGLAQFLSSDAHGLTERKRVPRLREALRAATDFVGEQQALALVLDNPAHILSDTPLDFTSERVPPRKRLFGLRG